MKGEPEPIDFTWVIFIGMNRLGFSCREVMRMYYGTWVDFFEVYKMVYNFETAKNLYSNEKEVEEERGSLMDI